MSRTKAPAKVISITSGKGGVGKTHTTVNLALALVKAGKRVLILDGDLGLANVNILLGFKPSKTLHEVLDGSASLKDVIVNDSSGIDIIPAASGIPELTNLTEAERLNLVEAFDDLADSYDFVLVDTAAGIGDNVLYFNVAAESILVVIGPEPTSITDAYALIKVLASRSGRREFDVVVNRTPAGTDGRATFQQLAAATDHFLNVSLKYLGSITDDESVPQAVVRQRPFLQLFPSSKASLDITKLAKKVAADETSRVPKGGLQFFFRALLEGSGLE
ncbi:MAG: MinD/ParA family protein [Bdellovibrionota bacterium]